MRKNRSQMKSKRFETVTLTRVDMLAAWWTGVILRSFLDRNTGSVTPSSQGEPAGRDLTRDSCRLSDARDGSATKVRRFRATVSRARMDHRSADRLIGSSAHHLFFIAARTRWSASEASNKHREPFPDAVPRPWDSPIGKPPRVFFIPGFCTVARRSGARTRTFGMRTDGPVDPWRRQS